MKKEVWKPIKDFEQFYEVSNLGRVRSKDRKVWNGRTYYLKKGRLLKLSKTTTGYWKVDLTNSTGKKKCLKVHRLVADAFIEKREGKHMVNHKDGNPLNNDVSNLEWCDQSENMKHAYENQLRKNNFHKYKNQIIEEYVSEQKPTIKDLAEKYNCSEISIRRFLVKNQIEIRRASELKDKYKINREELILDFKNGLRNKVIAKKHNTNTGLIAAYRYKFKKGELG